MQRQEMIADFLIRCREAMIEAKKIHPGWRAECLCPK